jgi:hypothetical protein
MCSFRLAYKVHEKITIPIDISLHSTILVTPLAKNYVN